MSGQLLDQPGFEFLEHAETRLTSNALVRLAAVRLGQFLVNDAPSATLTLSLSLSEQTPFRASCLILTLTNTAQHFLVVWRAAHIMPLAK